MRETSLAVNWSLCISPALLGNTLNSTPSSRSSSERRGEAEAKIRRGKFTPSLDSGFMSQLKQQGKLTLDYEAGRELAIVTSCYRVTGQCGGARLSKQPSQPQR